MISKPCYEGDHAHCGQWLSCNCPCHHSEGRGDWDKLQFQLSRTGQLSVGDVSCVPGPKQVVLPGNNPQV